MVVMAAGTTTTKRRRKRSRVSMQLACVALLLAVATAVVAVAGAGGLERADEEGFCDAMTGQCGIGGGVQWGGELETSRRELIRGNYLQARHISYGALSRDRVPCSRAGRSYYGCRGSGPANPYHRYCSRITHCSRDVS